MAYSVGRKACGLDDGCKQAGVYQCSGCTKFFCSIHVADHRRQLNEEMNQLIFEHDHLRNTILQYSMDPTSHPLMTQINQWEQESIQKIQRRAEELREEYLKKMEEQVKRLSNKFDPWSKQLNQAREHDDFTEPDLNVWKEKLESVQTNFMSSFKFSVDQNNNTALVKDRFITSRETVDCFHRVSDEGVKIEENGQLVTKQTGNTPIEIRGKNDYSAGTHRFRFRIEDNANAQWTFVGINSKSTPLQNSSHSSKSSYGWSSNNYSWYDGTGHAVSSRIPIEMKMNDIIILQVDCDNRQIVMINERTQGKYELTVDENLCPFPWQLHVIFYVPNSRMRMLLE